MDTHEDWLSEFPVKLQARCRRSDWPEVGTKDGDEFWRTLERILLDAGATAEVADLASARLATRSLKFVGEYPGALRDAIRSIRDAGLAPFPSHRLPAVRDTRPAHVPGPWDSIRTPQDLRDFCRSLGPIARPVSPGRRRESRDGAAWLPRQDAPGDSDGRTDASGSEASRRGV